MVPFLRDAIKVDVACLGNHGMSTMDCAENRFRFWS
jgi:hypothetical protein